MSTPRRLTTSLIILMLLLSLPTVSADDTDGDGVDDAQDDFPNDPCADTDTDGDGMPDSISCPSGTSGVVAYTSFEDPFTISSVKYTDTGDQSIDRYLWNNANEPDVAHNQTTGNEMGFTLYYESTGGVGLTDGDYFGTINYTGTVGNFTDGDNGYQMSDVDGIATLSLDNVISDIVSLDLFIQNTGYETSNPVDYLIIRFVDSSGYTDILNTSGYDIDSDFSSYLDTWTTLTLVTNGVSGNLEIEFSSNSGFEAIYIDNVIFSNSGSGTTTNLVEDQDDDNDGWIDSDESSCNTDALDSTSTPLDSDSDGTCNYLDSDDDDDGWSDLDEDNCGTDSLDDTDVPVDTNQDGVCDAIQETDNDGDGISDNDDSDDDNDNWTDLDELDCGTDPMDSSSVPNDFDGDFVCDIIDSDDDDDGVLDQDDAFPLDATESNDNDGDGQGDNADIDDDNDGWSDSDEIDCNTDWMDENIVPGDDDGDGVCNYLDADLDNDGVPDIDDAFPEDPNETVDTDGDGLGDNSDPDDDGDSFDDITEETCMSDPMDSVSIPSDFDEDTSCDNVDSDDDNDGVIDTEDAFPRDGSETRDTDGDGQGDNSDLDDDGDGWPDLTENNCGSDSMNAHSTPADADEDGQCDSDDLDDDGDGVADSLDAFPADGSEWLDLDSDGIGDNSDTDDDGDGVSDEDEASCNSDPFNADNVPLDWDEDGLCDALDADIQPPPISDETPGFGFLLAISMLVVATQVRSRKSKY